MASISDIDVVVIGGGAAGLAAAARLAAAEVPYVLLEARQRLGGRAFTKEAGGFPLDLGCGWLHAAERNPWVAIAEELGFTIDRTRPPWGVMAFDKFFSAADQKDFFAASAALDERLAAAAQHGQDRPAADLLEPGNRWNGLLDAISTYYSGVELARLSVLDYDAYREDGVNWRVRDGMGAAIARFGVPLAARLGTAVTAIDHSGRRLSIETACGTLTARAAIVTVPSAHIAQERLAFRPALPRKIEAAASLPLGLADKLVFAADEAALADLPQNSRLFGHTDRTATGSYHLRPFGWPLIEGYFGGDHARALEAEGDDGFAAAAREELARHLGSDLARRLVPIAATAWARDEFALGSYSYARPGAAGARTVLAAPVDGKLFFAGEATSLTGFSTAHGAYESGVRAADEALAALSLERVIPGQPGDQA
jgi:monoamine oxidase